MFKAAYACQLFMSSTNLVIRKYLVMLQNRQSHELINNAATIWLIEFGKNETTLINYFLATTWTKNKLIKMMGVTRTHYLDEVNLVTRSSLTTSSHHWRGKESHSMMPASSLDSYETSKTDRWEPNKSPIIGLEALLREALTLQRLTTKITYIKPLHWQHKVHILIF